MKVEKDTVVNFHYELFEQDGDFIESSKGDDGKGDPVAFLTGHNNIMPALEQNLLGLELGASQSVVLSPAQAYGEINAEAIQRVPVKHLLNKKAKLKPGMAVKVNTQDGPRDATVVKVGRFNVDLDTNHPLAGKTLRFEVTIDAIRAAEAEEIAHGHAHGIGGHHHD